MNGKRFFSALLCAMMVMTLLPTPSLAAGEVAEIVGGAQYATVKAAIDAAADGATVRLLDNVDISSESDTLTIRDINLTIDLNGKCITSFGPLAIRHNGTAENTLYIKDSSASGDGTISNSLSSTIISTGNITISGGTMISSGAQTISATYTATVSGGTVRHTTGANSAIYADRVLVSGGTVEGRDVTIICQDITISGGMVLSTYTGIMSPNVTLSGGMVQTSSVYPSISSVNVTVSGGTVRNTGTGDGLYAVNVVVSGGSINNISSTTLINAATPADEVKLCTLTLPGVSTKTAVTGITFTPALGYTYGLKDVMTDDTGKLYVWLPDTQSGASVSVTTEEKTYTGTIGGYAATLAATSDHGDLTVTGGMVGADYTYTAGVLTVLTATPLTVSGTATTDSIMVKSGITANITLSGVSIDRSTVDGACAFDIEAGSAANIWLEGDTTLKSGSTKAGLHVPSGAMLYIYGTGSLTAEGVLAEAGNKQGAGIGGNNQEACGTITIKGGNITAKGDMSAGIGGGNGGAGGTVFINGGTTIAVSAGGAGIGGGAAGYGGSVAISGGTVRATSDSQGAGIGGGASGNGGSVTILGGTVRANGNLGAGIGGGFNGDGGTVYISGGSVLAATSAGYAIGCGRVLVRQLDPGTLQNNSIEKTPVFLTAVTLDGVSSETAVTKLNHSYGMNNVFTDVSGTLYLYLPQETSTTWAQAASGEYVGSVVTASNHMASGTLALLPKEPTPAATFTATGPDCGTLENVEIGMKYRAHYGPFWHDVTASTMDLTGITPANGIQVKRLGDHSTTVDSDVQTITVTKAAVPSAGKVKCMTAANNDGMLTGVTSAMEYKKSGAASFTGITGSNVTGLTPGIYYVRVKASGTTLASDDQTLVIAPYNPGTAHGGDFTVTGGIIGTDYAYTDGVLTVLTSTPLTISGTSIYECIVVNSGITANITLSGVSIDSFDINDACAFDIEAGTTANITLDGDTTLKSGPGKAGLHVPIGATLTMNGTGSLTADAASFDGYMQGAGIGGNHGEACGTITINGGSITANGSFSAGIGGGSGGAGGTVFVNGGTIVAGSSNGGAGIGGNGGSVTITGGTVHATGSSGAGIGGGAGVDGTGDVTITGGTVIATSDNGAGIGSGLIGYSSSITISGGTVIASSHSGAGIGGGNEGNGGNVTIIGGTVSAKSVYGAGIGSGYIGTGGAVYISGGSVLATSIRGEAIGMGSGGSDSGTLQNNSVEKKPVFLTTITLQGVASETEVSALNHGYGMNDVFTDVNGNLYLYLPEATNTTWAQAASGEYAGSVATAANHTASGTLALLPKETTPDPSYSTRKLTDVPTGLTVSGTLSNDAKLRVNSFTPARNTADPALAAIRKRMGSSTEKLIFCADITISGNYSGLLTLSFEVGSQYNGYTVTLLHAKDGTLTTYTAIVIDGIATFTVTDLSPFALFAPNLNAVGVPNTGDGGTPYGTLPAFGILTLVAGISAVHIRRRHEKE